MKLLEDKFISNLNGAIDLVLRDAGQQEMSKEVIKLFAKSFDESLLQTEVDKSIKSEVQRYYGRNSRWRDSDVGPWYIPIPHLRYDSLPTPLLSFNLQPYLVAAVTVFDSKYSYHDVVLGPVGKPFKLTLPIIFLHAILNNSVKDFVLVSKDSMNTTWNVPGLNAPLTLPDEFVKRLSYTLGTKSVVAWLSDFGSQGRSLAPQVAGYLLGLQFGGKQKAVSLSEQAWDKDIVIAGLTRLYGEYKAKTLFNQELPFLNPGMTNEDALRVILQSIDKGD